MCSIELFNNIKQVKAIVIRLLLMLLLMAIVVACWPGPSYKDKDPRCKVWHKEYYEMKIDNKYQREFVKQLNVIDRYNYYICLQGMGTYSPNEDIFLNDADGFLKLIPNLLNEKVPGEQLFYMSYICLRIAKENPQVVRANVASINAINEYAQTIKSNWKDRIFINLNYIRSIIF